MKPGRNLWASVTVCGVALLAASCGTAKIHADCTMNGLGQGECSFTNTGDKAGSICGQIEVDVQAEYSSKCDSLFDCCARLYAGELDDSKKFCREMVEKAARAGAAYGRAKACAVRLRALVDEEVAKEHWGRTGCLEALALPSGGAKASSTLFCSGELEPNSTKAVGFNVLAVREMCSGGAPWNEICSFNFEEEREEEETGPKAPSLRTNKEKDPPPPPPPPPPP